MQTIASVSQITSSKPWIETMTEYESVTMKIRNVVKPAFGRYSRLNRTPPYNIPWRLAYDTDGVLGLDGSTQLFAWDGDLENFMKGPCIVLPQPQAYYRDNGFFQDCVAVDPIGRNVSNDLDQYAEFDWVEKFRCYVALKDFGGIQYTGKQAILQKLLQEMDDQEVMIFVFFHAEDDPQHPELIVIDNEADTEDSEDPETTLQRLCEMYAGGKQNTEDT